MSELVIFGSAQQEFWRREFKAKFIPKSGNYLDEMRRLIEVGIRPIVQIGQNSEEIVALEGFPKNSLIIHLYADETYRINTSFKLIKLPATYKILGSYPIPKLTILGLFFSFASMFLDILNSRRRLNVKNLAIFWAAGIVMTSRQVQLKFLEKCFRKDSVPILLGYTDIFCESYVGLIKSKFHESLDTYESLFLIEKTTLAKIIKDKEFDLCFVGQRGNIEREMAVAQSLRIKNSQIIVRDKFGGSLGFNDSTSDTGNQYLKVMLSSRYSLCPPGNYSGFSFRLMESLICGTYPIMKNYPLTDPFFINPIPVFKENQVPTKWKILIESSVGKAKTDVNQRIESGRIFLINELNKLHKHLLFLQRSRG